MKNIIILICLSLFCVTYGDSNCAATLSAAPPDPKTECCGVSKESGLKFPDSSSSIYAHPWVALLEYIRDGKVKTLCSGALISGKYVLTASHCIAATIIATVGKPVNVRLGEYDTENEGADCISSQGVETCTDGAIKIPIEKIIPHPEYKPNKHAANNDIGLIKMSKMAPYTDFIRPICLPTIDLAHETKQFTLTKAGWGYFEKTQVNTVKQEVSVPFVSHDKCQAAYTTPRQNITLGKGQICAGGEHVKDFCKGDAGLPLTYENGKTTEVVGLVSFGPAGCMSAVPTVYTYVYQYKAWILSNIEN